MEMDFDPVQKLTELMKMPITDEEKRELGSFIFSNLISETPVSDLRTIIESAVESNAAANGKKAQFTESDFQRFVAAYQQSKEPAGKVIEAFEDYRTEGSIMGISRVMRQSGFSDMMLGYSNIDMHRFYVKKENEAYKLVAFNGFSKLKNTKERTSFAMFPPEKGKALEEMIKNQMDLENKRIDAISWIIGGPLLGGLLGFLSGLVYMLATNSSDLSLDGMILGAMLPFIGTTAYSHVLKSKANKNLQAIENSLSDGSAYRHLSSEKPYDQKVILEAMYLDNQLPNSE